ncbi:MAG TPA: DUF2911 domain-containing protein [Candidatus Saccharimonadales bacterium]|jgi:hypothetical protein|nr:DUF2911 domain-containing protein [Candidatus Saccharimonadales bacterium]
MENMRKQSLFLIVLLAGIASCAISADAQVLSPPAKTACKFADGKTISVNYSSPRMHGRKIFGDLVPFGEVWRVGADDATTFVPNVDVTLGGKTVPAGRYTMFALPTVNKWTLIISKQIGEWGIPYPGEKFDFARMEMKVSKLSAPLENFTISFDALGSSCNMKFDWETTRASIDISEKK